MLVVSNDTIIPYCLCFHILALSSWYNHFPPLDSPLERRNFSRRSIITVESSGRLGNQIWEYMSLFVIWKQNYTILQEYDVAPVIHPETNEILSEIFEDLTISPAYLRGYPFDESYYSWFIPFLDPFTLPKKKDVKWIITLGQFSAKYKEVIAYGIDNIKKELRFKDEYLKMVNSKLSELAKKFYPHTDRMNVTFVGMHFRGGDYYEQLQYLFGNKLQHVASRGYYIEAMNYFKKHYRNIVFILLTTDGEFLYTIEDILHNGNVTVNPMVKRPGSDLALLAHCNHSIISYGTFGATAALFAGGTTIVFDLDVLIGMDGPSLGINIARILPDKWLLGNNSFIQDRKHE